MSNTHDGPVDAGAATVDDLQRLVSKYAHDMNNALAIVLGFSELLLSELAPGDERQKDLKEIHRAAEDASALTAALRTRVTGPAA